MAVLQIIGTASDWASDCTLASDYLPNRRELFPDCSSHPYCPDCHSYRVCPASLTQMKHLPLQSSLGAALGLRPVASIPEEEVALPLTGELDLEYIRSLCTLESRFWSEIHAPGKVGGPCRGAFRSAPLQLFKHWLVFAIFTCQHVLTCAFLLSLLPALPLCGAWADVPQGPKEDPSRIHGLHVRRHGRGNDAACGGARGPLPALDQVNSLLRVKAGLAMPCTDSSSDFPPSGRARLRYHAPALTVSSDFPPSGGAGLRLRLSSTSSFPASRCWASSPHSSPTSTRTSWAPLPSIPWRRAMTGRSELNALLLDIHSSSFGSRSCACLMPWPFLLLRAAV